MQQPHAGRSLTRPVRRVLVAPSNPRKLDAAFDQLGRSNHLNVSESFQRSFEQQAAAIVKEASNRPSTLPSARDLAAMPDDLDVESPLPLIYRSMDDTALILSCLLAQEQMISLLTPVVADTNFVDPLSAQSAVDTTILDTPVISTAQASVPTSLSRSASDPSAEADGRGFRCGLCDTHFSHYKSLLLHRKDRCPNRHLVGTAVDHFIPRTRGRPRKYQ